MKERNCVTAILIATLFVLAFSTAFMNISYAEREGYFFSLVFVANEAAMHEYQYYAAEWNKIGIHIDFRVVTWEESSVTTLDERRPGYEGGWDMGFVNVLTFTRTPDLDKNFHSETIPPKGLNLASWTNGLADKLLEKIPVTFDFEERKKLLFEFQEIFHDDMPVLLVRETGCKNLFGDQVVNTDKFSEAFGNTHEEYESLIWGGVHVPGKDTFVWAQYWWPWGGLPLWAPTEWANFIQWRRLIGLDPKTGDLYGDMAESWDIDMEAKTYTFHLKKDIVWSDGEPFDAEDVKFTFDVYTNPDIGALGYPKFAPAIESIEIADPYTVIFHATKMTVIFLENLALHESCIIPEHALRDLPMNAEAWRTSDAHTKGKVPVSGPMYTLEVAPKDYVKLGKNPKYNGPYPAPFEYLIFKVIPEAATAYAAIETDEIDGMDAWYYPDPSEWETFQANPKFQPVLTWFGVGNEGIALNHNNPILANKWVRRALSYSMPRDSYISEICKNLDKGNALPVQSTSPFFNPDPELQDHYSLEKARECMEKAGYLYKYLEPAPVPIFESIISAVIGLGVGAAVTFVTMRKRRRPE